ncbi:hypothetical protein O203_14390 [Ectopseudomonas chengduensis]|nr:hypothetical protein O203_14390 [Pseudomonas chengduensis]
MQERRPGAKGLWRQYDIGAPDPFAARTRLLQKPDCDLNS